MAKEPDFATVYCTAVCGFLSLACAYLWFGAMTDGSEVIRGNVNHYGEGWLEFTVFLLLGILAFYKVVTQIRTIGRKEP